MCETSAAALQYIESTLDDVLAAFERRPHSSPKIRLKRLKAHLPQLSQESGEVSWSVEDRDVTYTFPGQTRDEAWRFTCVLRILSEIHAAIRQNTIVTKRDIFYRDPSLFGKQDVVDRLIDDVAHTCGVQRSDLRVTASPKGLVAGWQADNEEPETIPVAVDTPDIEHIEWVLVIEKEASFRTLCDQRFHIDEHLGRGLLVTAKGYPDLATLIFLHSLIRKRNLTGRVFGLFDFDPYGIDILKCYRWGSKVSATEPNISIPGMKWIGVKSQSLMLSQAGEFTCDLTELDRIRARNIIDALTIDTEAMCIVPGSEDCIEELQRMLMLNRKAEIQTIETSSPRGLSQYLQEAMCRGSS